MLLIWLGLDRTLAVAACGAVTLVLRLGSMAFGWQLPVYRPRPPRR